MTRFASFVIAALVGLVAGNPVSRPAAITEHILNLRSAAPWSTQSGVNPDCTSWVQAKEGDNCAKIASAAGQPVASILGWNGGVGSKCDRLFDKYAVCIGAPAGTAATATSTTSAAAGSSSPAAGSPAAGAGSSAAKPTSSPPATTLNTPSPVVPTTSRSPGSPGSPGSPACGSPTTSSPSPPSATTSTSAAKNECK